MKKDFSTNNGFTLIETVIYLALFSIIIGGGMIAVYQIIQSTDNSSNQVILQEEANFLLRKINWSITGASAVTASSGTLTTTKPISGVSTNLTFTQTGSNITLQRNSGSASVLNSSSITISNLSFTKTTSIGKPDAITTSFILTTAENGRNVSETFSSTKYLRK